MDDLHKKVKDNSSICFRGRPFPVKRKSLFIFFIEKHFGGFNYVFEGSQLTAQDYLRSK